VRNLEQGLAILERMALPAPDSFRNESKRLARWQGRGQVIPEEGGRPGNGNLK
jgi:hypothetical protein